MPPEMLKKLNVLLLERKIEGHFITLTYSIWEPKSKTLRLANSGMPLPVLVRQGRSHAVRAEGVPLGLLEHTEYQEIALTLAKGDVLAFFSDGLVEAVNPQQEEFGMRRLENMFREHAQRPVAEIIDTVFEDIAKFEDGRPRRDDQTLVLIKVR